MSPHFALHLYNFASILCLKLENKSFKISFFEAFINSFELFLTTNSTKTTIVDMANFSKLARITENNC